MRIHCLARDAARLSLVVAFASALHVASARHAHAYDDSAFGEIETKYIFGFTEGSSIGLQGDQVAILWEGDDPKARVAFARLFN